MVRVAPPPEPWRMPGSAFYGHTCALTEAEMFGNFRATFDETARREDWTCMYCRCINPRENVHCEHCGAPHREAPPRADPAFAVSQLHDLQLTAMRLQALNARLEAQNADDGLDVVYETCGNCAGTGRVPGFFGRQKKCPECEGEGKVAEGESVIDM